MFPVAATIGTHYQALQSLHACTNPSCVHLLRFASSKGHKKLEFDCPIEIKKGEGHRSTVRSWFQERVRCVLFWAVK